MGLAFLPWEKWLPPYIFGPLLCVISLVGVWNFKGLSLWACLLLPFAGLWGAWGTWVWFTTGRNVFADETPKKKQPEGESGDEGRT
jgi:hypothetical protein